MNENNNGGKQILLSVLGVAILIVAVVGISYAAFTFAETGSKDNTINTGTISMTYTEGTNGITIYNAMPTADETGRTLTNIAAACVNYEGASVPADTTECTAANGQWDTGVRVFEFQVSATIQGAATINYEIAAIKTPACTGEGTTGEETTAEDCDGTWSDLLANTDVKLYLEKSDASNGAYTQVMAPTIYTPMLTAGGAGSPVGSMILENGSFTTTDTNYYKLRMWVDEDAVISNVQKKFTVRVNVYGKA